MKKSIGSGRGSVYNILLKALQTGDKYGYEICKEIEEKTNGSYILKQASLYSGLKRLEAQGDIKSYWQDSVLGGRRHYYSLTEKGKERIIRSNFSWTDARDDIVDNLFEKSQLDKEIESMQNDINQIKDNQALSEDNQKNIDYVLENTANLIDEQKDEEINKEENAEYVDETEENVKEENIPEEKKENEVGYSFDGDDLFSMFNTTYEDNIQESLEEKQEDQKAVENEEIINKYEEFDKDQNNSFENEKNEEDKQLDLFSISTTLNDDFQQKEEDIKDDNFDDIMQNMQTVENQQNNFNDKINEEDLEQKNEFIGHKVYEEYSNQNEEPLGIYDNKEQTLDDEYVDKVAETFDLQQNENNQNEEDSKQNNEVFSDNEISSLFEQNEQINQDYVDNDEELKDDEKISTLQKNNVDILEEYRKNHVSFNKFSDSTQFEEPENNFSNYLENNMFNDNETDKQEDLSLSEEQVSETIKEKPKEENVLYYDLTNNKEIAKDETTTTKQTSTLDYKDIFGDLISSQDENKNKEQIIENKQIETDSETSYVNEDQNKQQEEQNNFDDLPRFDSDMQDINRTFMQSKQTDEKTYSSSADFEKYDNSPFDTPEKNPFEKYDTYESMNYINNSNNNVYENEANEKRTNDLAFDKKYANIYNKFEVPDYEVRYFKKSNSKNNNQSKFISINRLNLAVSCILCLLMCVATTITLIVSSKNLVDGFQTTCYIFSYILLAVIISFDFTKYMLNKNKKVNMLNKNESLINLFFAIFVTILSISINLFLGMSFSNIRNYMGSFTLPLYYSLYLLIKFPLKKFLSKFANFYN